MSTITDHEFIVNLSCADGPGIVAGVSTFLAERRFSIKESKQFGDADTHRFFMRVHVVSLDGEVDLAELQSDSALLAKDMGLDLKVRGVSQRDRLLVMVSKQSHCLNDLLHRASIGALPAEIVAVASNHEDLRSLTEWHGVPFHHVPVTADTKQAAEDEVRGLVSKYDVDTVVLARYMQILSDQLCKDLDGRAINIHHSLLPSFKGARPYFQAYDRGVKVVGATAHYVTADLDEGPIIDQDFQRVGHALDALELTALGRDIEARTLARAVTAHAQRRVMLNGHRTVVFD
ncbi:formyltetrahydrofolate deformylase [Nocardioides sambongensis]|uniref:formyltetrahydrofolate deformylase n=1 Tax=Nocardioides sambongensis TaxID=2589074 RepID=UPI001E4FE055|nr:formyltetrahydrofolate deformylase [Nocardioides sambongensis]